MPNKNMYTFGAKLLTNKTHLPSGTNYYHYDNLTTTVYNPFVEVYIRIL